MRVHISDNAEAELSEIGRFIAQDSPARAESFVNEIVERCVGLGEHSSRYPVIGTFDGLEMRRFAHGRYLIFYSVAPDRVEIAHIVHGARDYLRVLYPQD